MIRSVIAAIKKILKVNGRDGRGPQNWEKNAPAGRFTCMHSTTARAMKTTNSIIHL
jgi:hypothetical protein